jgi:hypothetical protein
MKNLRNLMSFCLLGCIAALASGTVGRAQNAASTERPIVLKIEGETSNPIVYSLIGLVTQKGGNASGGGYDVLAYDSSSEIGGTASSNRQSEIREALQKDLALKRSFLRY